MTSRIRLAVLVAGAALALSACAAADYAATVNDVGISDADVIGLRTGEPEGRTEGEQFRGDLTTLIVIEAEVQGAAADFGITGLDTPEARATWLAQAGDAERNVVEGVASNPELTDSAVEAVTTQLMVRDAVSAALVRQEELLLRVWQEQQPSLVEVCPSHILVGSEEEAQEARDRVVAGEDFAAVADEVSLDTFSPGGALPCPSSPTNYVEPFATVVATAPVGELTEPFETEFGWHVVRVDSREFPESFEAFADEPERWLPQTVIEAAWANWRDDVVGRSSITVRSQIGTWFPQADGIIPPPASP